MSGASANANATRMRLRPILHTHAWMWERGTRRIASRWLGTYKASVVDVNCMLYVSARVFALCFETCRDCKLWIDCKAEVVTGTDSLKNIP